MAVLAQVPAAKLAMDANATNSNANLATVDSSLTELGYYHHGACLADFAVTCGNLTGVTLWAPVQSECDLGTLANNIDQTMVMDEVYVNSLEFGYTTGANATENYGAETDQKLWLLNDGRFVNYEELDYDSGDFTTSGTLASGVTIATFSDGSLGFLRTDVDGARAVTYFDASANNGLGEQVNWAVVSGTAAATSTFVYDESTDTLYLPTVGIAPAAGDKIFAVYSADGYVTAMGNKYFEILDVTERPDTIGALRQGQVEIYIVSDTDASYENAWRLTAVTITSDLTREALAELGHLGPYDRPLTVPIPITVTIDTTAGDLEHWSRFADRYSEFANDTMIDIDLADLFSSEDLKLVVKVFAQTDEEAGGTGSNRTIAVGSDLIGQDYFWSDSAASSVKGTIAAGQTERALKTIVVEHLKITDEAYTLDLGTNATQTFGFRSTNDLYVVKGDLDIDHITGGNKIRRNA